MKKLLFAMPLLMSLSYGANCSEISNPIKRLACYDKENSSSIIDDSNSYKGWTYGESRIGEEDTFYMSLKADTPVFSGSQSIPELRVNCFPVTVGMLISIKWNESIHSYPATDYDEHLGEVALKIDHNQSNTDMWLMLEENGDETFMQDSISSRYIQNILNGNRLYAQTTSVQWGVGEAKFSLKDFQDASEKLVDMCYSN